MCCERKCQVARCSSYVNAAFEIKSKPAVERELNESEGKQNFHRDVTITTNKVTVVSNNFTEPKSEKILPRYSSTIYLWQLVYYSPHLAGCLPKSLRKSIEFELI